MIEKPWPPFVNRSNRATALLKTSKLDKLMEIDYFYPIIEETKQNVICLGNVHVYENALIRL